MTEAEWLACNDPQKAIEFLRGKASDRKLRLFAVGCGRYVWHILPDDRTRQAVELAERVADALASEQELQTAPTEEGLQAAADAAFDAVDDNSTKMDSQSFAVSQGIYFAALTASHTCKTQAQDAAVRAGCTVFYAAVGAAGDVATHLSARIAAGDAVRQYRNALLNDIFGNPFQPVAANPAWLTPGVRELARIIYEGRASDRMPKLADALKQAGCTNPDILTHCRQPGEHVRGCWVVDLLLGKE